MDKDLIDIFRNILKEEINPIRIQLEENTNILKALDHKVDVISAEQQNLKHEVSEIKGEIKAVRKDLSNVEVITASNWSDLAKLKAVK
jgi:chromosome segregation ATPase